MRGGDGEVSDHWKDSGGARAGGLSSRVGVCDIVRFESPSKGSDALRRILD